MITDNIKQEIGNRLKEERDKLKLTQPSICDLIGTKKRTLYDWEKGLSSPSASQFDALDRAGFDVKYIITGKRSNKENNALAYNEHELLEMFRNADEQLKNAAIRVLSVK